MSKRKEYFIKQGYSVELIEYLGALGVETHMLWFLTNLTRIIQANKENNVFVDEFKNLMVNEYLELSTKNKFKSFEDAVTFILSEKEKEERIKRNTIHTFSDGLFIVKLTAHDLGAEANMMSNCLGTFTKRVQNNDCAILALKNKKGETLVHIQIQKNGVISQNYEKANGNVRLKYWKYIYEFLKKNSKNVDTENFFDFGWKLHVDRNNFLNLECVLPTSTLQKMGNKREKISFIAENTIIKKFAYKMPGKINLISFKKKDLAEEIQEYRNHVNTVCDELTKELEMTEGKNLYISDELKERLFGKDAYFLKGEDYNFNDLLYGLYGENRELMAMEEAARQEPERDEPIHILRGLNDLREAAEDDLDGEGIIEDGGEDEEVRAEIPENLNPNVLIGRIRPR